MATKPKGGKRSDAQTEIEDLDVREVSVVDRPAIRRKFLIVKSEDGLEVIRQEEDPKMAPKSTDAENLEQEDILDLLDVNKDGNGEEPTKAVDRLMVLAATLKDEEGETISSDSCEELCSITETLAGQPVDKAEVAKLTPHEAEARVSKAVGQMMIVAKGVEDGSDEELGSQCQAIAVELAPLAKSDEGSISNQDGTLKVFVVAGGGEDPELLIQKAGAKMKRSRLSAFEKAVQTLVTLLSEIKGEQPNDKNKKTQKSSEEDQDMSTKDKENKDKEQTTKDQDAEAAAKAAKEKEEAEAAAKAKGDKDDKDEPVTKDWVKDQINQAITKGNEPVMTAIKELGDKFDKAGEVVESLSKRMDEVDNTAPAGEGEGGDAEGEATEKKDKPFWGGRFLQ